MISKKMLRLIESAGGEVRWPDKEPCEPQDHRWEMFAPRGAVMRGEPTYAEVRCTRCFALRHSAERMVKIDQAIAERMLGRRVRRAEVHAIYTKGDRTSVKQQLVSVLSWAEEDAITGATVWRRERLGKGEFCWFPVHREKE